MRRDVCQSSATAKRAAVTHNSLTS
jgi:hypothetical protein